MKFTGSLSVLALAGQHVSAAATTRRNYGGDWSTQEWDAIIVGGGTAGLIVADRLSEAGKKTLVLEGGGASYGMTGGTEKPTWLDGSDLSRVDVPGLYKSIFSSSNSSLLCTAEEVGAYQACTVGGNSAINAGLYFQPPSSDWDLYHPEGWKSQDVKGAVSRLLQRLPSVVNYSQDGKLYLQTGYEAAKEWIVDAAGFSEITINDEADNKEKVFGHPSFDYIGGQRGGPVRTYLQTALKRPNFHLQTGVRVKYINRNGTVAHGVHANISGTFKDIALAKNGKVIVSSGAVASPAVLYYSGIGPTDLLTNLSAASFTPYNSGNWIVNSEVGVGIFDNPNTFIELSAPTVESFVYSYDNISETDKELYLSARSGPYSFASETSVFWGYVHHEDGTQSGIQGTIDSAGYTDYMNNNTITLNIYGTSGLLSSGRVLFSDDGNFTPTPNGDVYYSNPRDAADIASFIYDIFQSLPDSTPESPAANGLTPLNIPRNSTLEEIQTYITTWSAYARGEVQHWSSSCRLGKCVDANTKVVGTSNIHVIDASIVSPLTVNPQFGVMVAAEKGSEQVLASW